MNIPNVGDLLRYTDDQYDFIVKVTHVSKVSTHTIITEVINNKNSGFYTVGSAMKLGNEAIKKASSVLEKHGWSLQIYQEEEVI
jgi:hypothetical protein